MRCVFTGIKDLGLERNLIQRMFGLGTIRVVSSDSSLGNFDLTNVKNSSDVKEQLSRLVEEERQRKRFLPENLSALRRRMK